jgi:hypothetical protein
MEASTRVIQMGAARSASIGRRTGAWGVVGLRPAVVVAVMLAILFGNALLFHQANVTGFIQFGSHFRSAVKPPSGAIVASPRGYDGQFFWLLARDPFLGDSTVKGLRHFDDEFRAQRIGYPVLARALAGGNLKAVPYTLLIVSILAILTCTFVTARFAVARGHSELWGLAFGLAPGVVIPALRDLGDAVAVAAMICGLIAWRRDRRVTAAACLSLAVLTREPMLIAVTAVAFDAAVRAGRPRPAREWLTRMRPLVWPAVAVPFLMFFAWYAYVVLRFGGELPGSGGLFGLPFAGTIGALRGLHGESSFAQLWDLSYLVLMLVAIGTALWRVRTRRTASAFAAAGFALVSLVSLTPDHWSFTRYSAPLFLSLFLSALEERKVPKAVLWPAGAAVALTALLPAAGMI